jgi:hypothetical protein
MIAYDAESGTLFIPAKGLRLDFDDYDEDSHGAASLRKLKPARLILTRSRSKNWNYTV